MTTKMKNEMTELRRRELFLSESIRRHLADEDSTLRNTIYEASNRLDGCSDYFFQRNYRENGSGVISGWIDQGELFVD